MTLEKLYNAPFFQNSVRVFYLVSAVWAIFIPAWTVTALVNNYGFPHERYSLFHWHGYQMIYTFFYTMICGFILTAGGYWTGKGPLRGRPLTILLLLWLIEQILFFTNVPNILILIATICFMFMFLYCSHKVLKSYKYEIQFMFILYLISFMKCVALLSLLKISYISPKLTNEITIYTYIVLVTIIAGRITPRFTKNFFNLDYNLEEPKNIKLICLLSTILLYINILSIIPNSLKFVITFFAAFTHFFRLGMWKPHMAIKKPTIGFLHIGYFLFACSLMFKSITFLLPDLDVFKSSTHFILSGSITFIGMNIMIRASLGHTGRKIYFDKYILTIFFCIFIGFTLRVFLPIIDKSYFIPSLHHSMGWWTLGFILFLLKFGPTYFLPRADQKQL